MNAETKTTSPDQFRKKHTQGKMLLVCAVWMLSTMCLAAQTTDLPLFKGHGGADTAVQFTHAFTVLGRTFTPVEQVTVHWRHSQSHFLVSGDVLSEIDGEMFHFKTSGDTSYFKLNGDSSLFTYALNVIDTFILSGQKFIGETESTWYRKTDATADEVMHGDVQVILDGAAHDARMGSFEDPGTRLADDAIDYVWVHLNDITLKGLKTKDLPAAKTDLFLRHDADDPEGKYYGYGTWVVWLVELIQVATLGTAENPGIVINHGVVQSVTMVTGGGGILFGGFPVVDGFVVTYNDQHGKYAINGFLTIGVPLGGFVKALGAKYAPSFQINAGTAEDPGFLLNLSNGRFEVEDAAFSLLTINGKNSVIQGGFQLNDLQIIVRDNWPDSIHAKLTMPPGISLAAGIGFVLHKNAPIDERLLLNSIDVTWEASMVSQAVPVANTGFSLVKFVGGVDDLHDPNNWHAQVTVGLIFGKAIQINAGLFPNGVPGLKEVAIVYVEGIVEWGARGLTFGATGDCFAAYQMGTWSGLVAELEADVNVFWGGKVTMDANLSMYAPPGDFLNATAEVALYNSGDIDATGSASLQVPHIIPIIGGKHLESAHFALRYRALEIAQSYGAAWARFNLGFDHVTLGAKANFGSGKVSKVGAKEARAITKDNISDNTQHPIGPDGQPDLDWYACGLKNHFTLTASKPAAYIQNQLIVNNNVFHNSALEYYGPAVAVMTSPSSDEEVKHLTPGDPEDIYVNQGQTMIQDNTINVDFTQIDPGGGGSDTLRWITVNQAVEAYTDIDWVHQPEVFLTPGEYILSFSGYCPTGGFPLLPGDMSYSASPVFPRPTISLSGDGGGTFTIDYSSYLTDSTTVSLYWNYEKNESGNLIGHLPYYGGTLIGDSLYQWVVENWYPGITTERKIYFYAVIDDFVNNPVRTGYDSIVYTQNLAVTIYGGTDSTAILLSPADTTMSDVYGLNNWGGNFVFCNLPVGEYTIHCFNADPGLALTLNMGITGIDGHVINAEYHSPEWTSLDFEVVTWDNGIGGIYFYLEEAEVQLFGTLTDTSDVPVVDDAGIYVLSEQDVVLGQSALSDLGYRFTDQDAGYVRVAVRLPSTNNYHWPPTHNLRHVNVPGLTGIVYVMDSVEINSVSKAVNFRVLPGSQGPVFYANDLNNNPVTNVVITIRRQDGMGSALQASTDENGLAFFPGEVATFTNYIFSMAWPDGYSSVTLQNQTFQWSGTTDPQVVTGRQY